MKMDSESLDQRKLAYELLIELLAHQFAFPVKWIDTQNSLLLAKQDITRFVELGPGRVLTNMGKRTRDLKYSKRDRIFGLERQFLASTQDFAELQYQYDPEPELETTQDQAQVSCQISQPALAATSPSVAITAVECVADVPIPSLEIVLAVIANKLKKTIDQISNKKSIKELVGGKSTLQNELIGDLAVEFGTTPDSAEDLSLESLAESFQVQHTGQLGKLSTSLIARFVSSSMPAKFSLNNIRDHLSLKWGLGASRQGSVLLFAVTQNAVTGRGRLPSIEAAKNFIDLATTRYAESVGLVLQAQPETSAKQAHATTHTVVDSGMLAKISQDQRNLATKHLSALSEYLNIDNNQKQDVFAEFERKQLDLEGSLSLWTSEFGEDFASGIKPCFDSRKSRNFNFSWNQARQEIITLFHNSDSRTLENSSPAEDNVSLMRKCISISNKSSGLQTLQLVLDLVDTILVEERECHSFTELAKRLTIMMSRDLLQPPRASFRVLSMMPQTSIGPDCAIHCHEIPRTGFRGTGYSDLLRHGISHGAIRSSVYLSSCRTTGSEVDNDLSELFLGTVEKMLGEGATFQGKNVLVTGAGPGSIGAELIRSLLSGGANVIVTTSREPSATSKFYQELFAEHGSRRSSLLVLPFNQASATDCKDLIEHIFNASGLARNLDVLIPFAAMSEVGIEIDSIDSKSELAHRVMLTNIIRLLGHMVRCKNELGIDCRPTQVILPLSPNHGIFGGDGLYSESKIGLQTLLNRFTSESWADMITICGAIIGWTRGTGLMQQNDIVAEAVENHGVLTFSQKEMALNILALMDPAISQPCEDFPIIADFSGGLGSLENCKTVLSSARERIKLDAEIVRAIQEEDQLELSYVTSTPVPKSSKPLAVRSTLQIPFPPLPEFEKDLGNLEHLQDMVDLSGTIVIVGYSELGPWGNARTRWEMESQNKLSQSGYIELAWMMNLIKHFDGETAQGHFIGWVDTKTGEQVHDSEIEAKYGSHIISNSGIRFIDPEMFNGYDPNKKQFLQEIAIEEDMQFDTDITTGEAFKKRFGDKVKVQLLDGQDQCHVRLKSGAHIMVPKNSSLDSSLVAGQFPKGWNSATYGIEEDIVRQVDPVTVYTLCCVAEALFSAGITNAMEIYKHIHTSEIGNFIGSSMGGTEKTRQMYRDVFLDKEVQGDIIQETFLNTPAAWVNMLLLGGNGPIKTPVGACATGVESIDIGCESILSGKTKICLVGGTDNFHEDESYGFSTMKATVNTMSELLHGRSSAEMSRPSSESRAGFVESQGCGIQILCSADLAIEMGLPIYGIVAGSAMAADKISRSVPAPGQGVLTFARETSDASHSPLLNLDYRREQMRRAIITHAFPSDNGSRKSQSEECFTPLESETSSSESITTRQLVTLSADHTLRFQKMKAIIQRQWGNEFRRLDTNISPLRASLAVWGLTVDDIGICSLHGTSTKANDKNEPAVVNQQMRHLGRRSVPLIAISQKSLTGHPKAPAASWMLNGCLQVLSSGLVPGNYNLDNIDPALEEFEHLMFPTKPIQTREVKAFLLSSFGFGQKGGQLVGVHSKYLFATMAKENFEKYAERFGARKRVANRAFVKAIHSNTIFKAQMSPPYHSSDEAKIFLDPLARISKDSKTGRFHFDSKTLHGNAEVGSRETATRGSTDIAAAASLSKTWIEGALANRGSEAVSVGIDVEDIDKFNSDNDEHFVARNYTVEEQAFASKSLNPHRTYASRWCAKEAVFKSLGTRSKGAGAPLRDIEIEAVDGNSGPKVRLHGDAAIVANENGIRDIQLSLSYSDNSVVAVALALRGN